MQEIGLDWTLYKSPIRLKEVTAPSTNSMEADTLALYAKDKSGVSNLYWKNDAGTEFDLSAVGLTGTGTTNRMTYWSSSTGLAANAALTTGRVPFADANGLLTDSANLFWDSANTRLGIGTTSPTRFLHVHTTAGVTNSLTTNCAFSASSTGTPAAGFGFVEQYYLANASGTQVLAADYGVLWSVATASSEAAAWFWRTGIAGSMSQRFAIDAKGNVIVNTAAIATNATDGFLYVDTCAGAPSGTPTTYTGRCALVYDTTNNKLCVYNGAWKTVTLA